jgi:hypothetical protein
MVLFARLQSNDRAHEVILISEGGTLDLVSVIINAQRRGAPRRKELQMKKLMTAMLALAFLTATAGVGFAQDTTSTTKKESSTGKKTRTKKGGKKEDTQKKGGTN